MLPANINIDVIHAFNDNYIWLVKNQQHVALVDPGDADVCINYLAQHQLILTDILITHHHQDHIGGIQKLLDYCAGKNQSVNVYAPKANNIQGTTDALIGGEVITLTHLAITFDVIAVPGHTLGHIAYLATETLFCGDTLFSGGCGRLFEGTPDQMSDSLGLLANLSESTKVYCSHEYTLSNLQFALMVEPNNLDLLNYYNQAVELREKNLSTLPSTIGLEKRINPFLRCHLPEVQEAASEYSNQVITLSKACFAVIRQWKDSA